MKVGQIKQILFNILLSHDNLGSKIYDVVVREDEKVSVVNIVVEVVEDCKYTIVAVPGPTYEDSDEVKIVSESIEMRRLVSQFSPLKEILRILEDLSGINWEEEEASWII